MKLITKEQVLAYTGMEVTLAQLFGGLERAERKAEGNKNTDKYRAIIEAYGIWAKEGYPELEVVAPVVEKKVVVINEEIEQMDEWTQITVNTTKIMHETGKMTLIKMNDSKEGIWFATKLLKQKGKNGYLTVISLNKNFEYLCSNKVKYNIIEVLKGFDKY